MSAWGTGVQQSDEFADVYDEFFEQYTGDADPFAIRAKIWEEYTEEFSEPWEDQILYTVRYALAQCLWECGKRDEALWAEIDEIIHTGKDLQFWGELTEQNPKLQKQRQKSLEQFWTKINSEPKRIRKPKKTTEKRPPTLHKGDVFAYPVPEGGYRAAVVFDYVWNSFLFAVTDVVFSTCPPWKPCGRAGQVWFSGATSAPQSPKRIVSQSGHTRLPEITTDAPGCSTRKS